ncbi:mannose-6-phosphate isomerase, type 1 [Coriobacterium glomerans PW2]|uniref:Mannose-6-phosphate isomerase, type 1 n=1 Tax=Coriobacterium glomerans (strain ATCC 49209 / DSM 20642 / JCM 10262 / PW2) TaxID=700015 RepID=F2N8W0_CORGP|nr:type I phosphomannose isomerase catalytic subunit [Coriobacterium glomerans]AEB07560.1 mannose-6-phosphate isomerase, type 1 [Coriobacterium glomerans PW2]
MESMIKLIPQFKEKIWGGRRLATDFGYDIPAGPVGECWAISAHPSGDDVIATGRFSGQSLSWLWEHHRELFGDAVGDRFPLLVKIIDAKDDLSIQVHPDDAYAAEHEGGSLGKKECWYVLAADPGQTIVIGQRARARDEFARMAREGRWNELLNEVPVRPGDFFQIDPGTVHAIKGGTLILETQQSSDVTYRVYDYDRLQDDGTHRELHMAQALDVIDFDQVPPCSGTVNDDEAEGVTVLETNECYTVERVRCVSSLTYETRHPFTCVSVIAGEGTLNGEDVRKGSHLLALSGCERIDILGEIEMICSYQ